MSCCVVTAAAIASTSLSSLAIMPAHYLCLICSCLVHVFYNKKNMKPPTKKSSRGRKVEWMIYR